MGKSSKNWPNANVDWPDARYSWLSAILAPEPRAEL